MDDQGEPELNWTDFIDYSIARRYFIDEDSSFYKFLQENGFCPDPTTKYRLGSILIEFFEIIKREQLLDYSSPGIIICQCDRQLQDIFGEPSVPILGICPRIVALLRAHEVIPEDNFTFDDDMCLCVEEIINIIAILFQPEFYNTAT